MSNVSQHYYKNNKFSYKKSKVYKYKFFSEDKIL